MRRIRVRKNIRLGIIILCSIVIGSLILLTFNAYSNPGLDEKKVTLYSYESNGKINYEVFLKPNSLYEKKSLGEDQVYLSNLIDYLDTIYSYEFTGESVADIKGNYEITAVVEGYTGEADKITTIWKKEFPLVTKTDFQAKDKKFIITKKIPIKLDDFSNFAQKVMIESKLMNTQTKLTTYMNVEISAQTDKGLINKKSTSSIEVPLGVSYFKVFKKQGENKPEAIEEVKQVQRPINSKLLTLYGIGLGISVVALLFVIFVTKRTETNPFIRELKRVFKKHGTRLVALNTEIATATDSLSSVRSMEDLVRISDELGRPIIYKHNQDYKEISKFWVIDGNRYYIFELTEESHPSFKERVGLANKKENTEKDI